MTTIGKMTAGRMQLNGLPIRTPPAPNSGTRKAKNMSQFSSSPRNAKRYITSERHKSDTLPSSRHKLN